MPLFSALADLSLPRLIPDGKPRKERVKGDPTGSVPFFLSNKNHIFICILILLKAGIFDKL